MYNIIPLILILFGFVVIFFIVVRKFSVLANLDIESIPAEREKRFKEQIIGKRIKRSFVKYGMKSLRIIGPIGGVIGRFFRWTYNKLIEYREVHRSEEIARGGSSMDAVEKLYLEAEELVKEEKFSEAEKKYIDIISIDSRNFQAFRKLGRLYYDKREYNEAEQTLLHALRLSEKPGNGDLGVIEESEVAGLYFDLSLVSRSMERYEEALRDIDKSLRIEPNNPRYLDTKLEICIIMKDKVLAGLALEKLSEVNPENQKLAEFQAKIDEL